jgi:hypothetical protein
MTDAAFELSGEQSRSRESTADAELLELALIALSSVGYETSMQGTGRSQLLFADNTTAAIAVGASNTVAGLLDLESDLSAQLLQRMGARRIPERRRDGYVVLLTVQSAEAQQSEALFGMTYNLRHVRRIVRVAVEPTAAGVARALRPVLPLMSIPRPHVVSDPLESLERRLLTDGLSPSLVTGAIARFRSGLFREDLRREDEDID